MRNALVRSWFWMISAVFYFAGINLNCIQNAKMIVMCFVSTCWHQVVFEVKFRNTKNVSINRFSKKEICFQFACLIGKQKKTFFFLLYKMKFNYLRNEMRHSVGMWWAIVLIWVHHKYLCFFLSLKAQVWRTQHTHTLAKHMTKKEIK